MSGRTPRILIDTTPWLYYVLGDERLESNLREHIDKSAKHGKLYLSAASIGEVARMIKNNQITLQQPADKWLQQALQKSKTQILPCDEHTAFESENLPKAPSGLSDAEKIILATARHQNILLLSKRPHFKLYAGTGFIKIKS